MDSHARADLVRLFLDHNDNVSDKWEHYPAIYQRELAAKVSKGEPLCLLEIGVQNGGSLQIWSKYLPLGSNVIGLDIDEKVGDLKLGENIEIFVVNGADPKAVCEKIGDRKFDVIIDDGSHLSSDVINTFEHCFARLAVGGVYFIEDVHCSYMASYEGGFRKHSSIIEHFKALADAINFEHFEQDVHDMLSFEALDHIKSIGRQISSVSFYESLIVVRKLEAPRERPLNKLIAGSKSPVFPLESVLDVLSNQQLRDLLLTSSSMGQLAPLMLQRLVDAKDELLAQIATEQKQKELAASREAQLQNANRDAQARLGELEVQLQNAQARLEEPEAQLQNAQARLVFPIRALAQRLPPKARRLLRRAAKGIFWLATGQIVNRMRARANAIKSARETSLLQYPPSAEPYSYASWCRINLPESGELQLQKRLGHALAIQPKFSVLVPVFQTPIDVLCEMIESLVAQSYSNWELCLAVVDEGVISREIIKCVHKFALRDNRIVIRTTDKNFGISGNSNISLDIATGEWSIILDHDDTIAPNALYEIARAINQEPDACFVYSDKDSVDRFGKERFNPLFKPNWSPEMMLGANYLTHMCAMRTDTLREIGGWDSATDGAQDWDIFLRVILTGGKVVHVPRVLYHWRWLETSVAARGFDAKPYALEGQIRTLGKYLPRAGWPGATAQFNGVHLRIEWACDFKPFVSIVKVGSGGSKTDHEITTPLDFEILRATGSDIAAAVDKAIGSARGEIIVLIDQNFVPGSPQAIEELVLPLANPMLAFVAGRVEDSEARIIDFGFFFQNGSGFPAYRGESTNYYGPSGGVNWYRNASGASAGAISFRKTLWRELGGIARYQSSGRSDLAFVMEGVSRGCGRLMLNPFSQFIAKTGLSAFELEQEVISRNAVLKALPFGDPYLNPNLDLDLLGAPILKKPVLSPVTVSHDFFSEARWVASSYDTNHAQVKASIDACRAEPAGALRRVIWLIPDFHVAFYGGINTILRNAAHMLDRYGIHATFAIQSEDSDSVVKARIARAFPKLALSCDVVNLGMIEKLPRADAAICTLWTTAYPLLQLRNVRRKFYFVQDWEPQFYPSGTLSTIVEATYRFGFHAICNTPSLAASYRELGGQADHFLPAIDPSVFNAVNRPPRGDGDPFVLVCYTRPGTPRNCFEALSEGMRLLKNKFDTKIEIITAGAEWDPSDYDLGGIVRNLGLLPYAETATLYRVADAGLVAMATRHPSYLPFEWMACGATVVTNRNIYTEWLLRDQDNCLLCEMNKTDIYETVAKLIMDRKLRDRLATTALKDIASGFDSWDRSCESVFRILSKAAEASPT
jgi:O-antigen biosynthesis protein